MSRGKWRLLETCRNSKSSLHYVITRTCFCISVYTFLYKPNTNAVSGKGSSIPCQQSPVVVVFNSMIPQYRAIKTFENRASIIEDTKSRRAKTIACQLFALARSALFVHCSSATCKVSVNAVCIPDDLSMTSYRCCLHERIGRNGQTKLGRCFLTKRLFYTLA